MNRYRIVCGLIILIPLMTGCSPEGIPQTIGTSFPTETQNIVTWTPTDTNTPTLSPTISNTPTPIQPDLEIINWAFVAPTFYFRKTYFVAIIRNNSDYGIIAPNGGVVTLECAGGIFSDIYLADVPPLAPHGEAVFLQTASETLACSPIKKVTIKYEVNGMVLTDNNHEVPNWKTEVMKGGWASPAYRLTNSNVTVENTSQYPCMVEEIITLAFDYNDTIIGMGISELSDREGESVPIPPQEKMGFYIYVDTGVYNHAQKLMAYPIAKGNSFCINPDEIVDTTLEKKAEFPYGLKHRLEVTQSGGWGDPRSYYSERWYFGFMVKNENPEYWTEGLTWHADVYDGDGRLIDYSNGYTSMTIPPLGISAGSGRGHFYSLEIAGWQKDYRVKLFVYTANPRTKSSVELPLVETIDWSIEEGAVLVSCTIYNSQSYAIKDMCGAVALLFDQNQNIIGGGEGEITNSGCISLDPGERMDLTIYTYSSGHPEKIEIYPLISLYGQH
jgi:hypothetical protein